MSITPYLTITFYKDSMVDAPEYHQSLKEATAHAVEECAWEGTKEVWMHHVDALGDISHTVYTGDYS